MRRLINLFGSYAIATDFSLKMPFVVNNSELQKFFELVKLNPVIYDTKQYRNVTNKDKCEIWDKIAVDMGIPDVDGDEWRKKWRTQRDQFVRKKRQMAVGGMDAIRASQWRYWECLEFLEPFVSDISLQEEEAAAVLGVQEGSIVPCITSPGTPSVTKVVSKLFKSKKALKRGHPTGSEQARNTTGPDDIDVFFNSCARKMRKISPDVRSIVEFQISQVLFNAEHPAYQQPILSLPTHAQEQPEQTNQTIHVHVIGEGSQSQ